MRIVLQKKEEEDEFYIYMRPLLSLMISVIMLGVLLIPYGVNPIELIISLFIEPFLTLYGITDIILRMIPLLLCGIGLIIAFKAKLWNIGAEGQLLMGAVAATWVALFLLPNGSPFIVIPLMYILGFLFGGLWALLPAYLKAKWQVNEVLTTLMMNYIAMQIVYYLIFGPWRGKKVYNYPITDIFPESAQLPVISARYPIHYTTLILALLSALGVYFLLTRTKIGYELKTYGSNPEMAKVYGISPMKVILFSMFLSGGLAGLAGVGEVAGIHHMLRYPDKISSGYGYTAILVAWLANLNPITAILSSFLLGLLITGTRFLQTAHQIPFGIVKVIIGLMLLSLAATELLLRYRIKIIREG